MKQAIFISIAMLLMLSVYGSFNLSLIEFHKKNVCPKVLAVPACYIVFGFFVLALLSHALTGTLTTKVLFFVFLSIPFIMALGGTVTEISGKVICPRTSGGIPMCFISLGICLILIIGKVLENKDWTS